MSNRRFLLVAAASATLAGAVYYFYAHSRRSSKAGNISIYNGKPQTVLLCGGGNAVHVLAADLGAAGHKVVVYAPYADEAQRFNLGLASNHGKVTVTHRGIETSGVVSLVTKDAAAACRGVDVALLPIPSFAHETLIRALAPHLPEKTIIIAMPAQGGFDYRCRQWLLELREENEAKSFIVAGTNQLPYQCRISEYGRKVDLIGHKREVGLAAVPASETSRVASLLTSLIQRCKISTLPHFLTVTLTPGNQVIHPCIMWGLFNEYEEGKTSYDKLPLFYQETNETTAAMMDAVSAELIAIADAISQQASLASLQVPKIDDMMRLFYKDEIVDASTTMTIFRSNLGYAGLRAPMKKQGEKYVPNFDYRYLTEDIPNGLIVCKGLAELVKVRTPSMDRVIEWAQRMMHKQYLLSNGTLAGKDVGTTAAPQASGIKRLDEIM